jgi:hypothetical protein
LRPGNLLLDHGDFQIRFGPVAARHEPGCTVSDRTHARRDYKTIQPLDAGRRTRSVSLQACQGLNPFGRVDVFFDSEAGIPADIGYAAEIDVYRSRGAKVAQVARLAVEPHHGSKEFLGTLFHLVYIFLALGQATDIFIEVHPRHAPFYRRMLSFRSAGECKPCRRVDALAVLMHVELSHAAQQIDIYGGHRREARTLYSYFCSKEEEFAMLSRLLPPCRL